LCCARSAAGGVERLWNAWESDWSGALKDLTPVEVKQVRTLLESAELSLTELSTVEQWWDGLSADRRHGFLEFVLDLRMYLQVLPR
jgi:hypothetical protein